MFRILWIVPLLLLQDDPLAALKSLPVGKPTEFAKLQLYKAIENETAVAWKALAEGRLAEFEKSAVRVAQMTRPYSDDESRRLAASILAVRRALRFEGSTLALLVATRPDPKRIDDALRSPLLSGFKSDVDRIAQWLKATPTPAAIEAELLKWKTLAPASPRSDCATCKGSGEADCATCINGFVAQDCRTCSAKGQVTCVLCQGTGGLVHGGYTGKLRVVLEKDTTIRMVGKDGKKVDVVLPAQTIIWTVGACAGGSFTLGSVSAAKDPKIVDRKERNVVSCRDFYDQLERFVFNGKAKIWIGDDPSKSKPLTAEVAKRFFGEYAKCQEGRVACVKCAGTKLEPCSACSGKGSRPAPCGACGGADSVVCATCRMSGDAAWLAERIPADAVPELREILRLHSGMLIRWQEALAGQIAHREQLRFRLAELQKSLDPKAKLEADRLTLPCAGCKGSGGACPDCWGIGKREYVEGTAEFETYNAARRAALQFAAESQPIRDLSGPPLTVRIDDVVVSKPSPPAPTPQPEPTPVPEKPGNIGGTLGKLSVDLQELVKKGDAAYADGKSHLEKAKASSDNDVWTSESKQAIVNLREAQRCFTTVQEALDEKGLDVPRELLEMIRNNMQALVMARKQSP